MAEAGNLAKCSTRPNGIPAVGGAMDLIRSARRFASETEHSTRHGAPKSLDRGTLPMTGVACVTRVYTSVAVIDTQEGHFVLREKLADIPLETLQSLTGDRLYTHGLVAALNVLEVLDD